MCADSQETYADLKWPVQKLQVEGCGYPIMITGAGFGAAIDTATQRIREKLRGGYDQETALKHIVAILRDIDENDLAHMPNAERLDLGYELLFAIRTSDQQAGLFHAYGSLVTRVENFHLVGSGSLVNFFAHSLYRKTSWNRPILQVSEGKVLAAYLVNLAKSQLSTVGGRSQIATLDANGVLDLATTWEVPAWERFFTEFWYMAGDLMLRCADPTYPLEEFNKFQENFTTVMTATKEGLIRERKEWEDIFRPVSKIEIEKKTKQRSTPRKSLGRQ